MIETGSKAIISLTGVGPMDSREEVLLGIGEGVIGDSGQGLLETVGETGGKDMVFIEMAGFMQKVL